MLSDEEIARKLATTFADADAVPDCTKDPARYQLYVLDQVEKRRSDEDVKMSENARNPTSI